MGPVILNTFICRFEVSRNPLPFPALSPVDTKMLSSRNVVFAFEYHAVGTHPDSELSWTLNYDFV
jgi:hypothetical protein